MVLTTTRVFTGKDLAKLDWSVLILIAEGISLGTGMQMTGELMRVTLVISVVGVVAIVLGGGAMMRLVVSGKL